MKVKFLFSYVAFNPFLHVSGAQQQQYKENEVSKFRWMMISFGT